MDWKRPYYLRSDIIDHPRYGVRACLLVTAGLQSTYTNWRLDWLWILASSKQQRNKMQVER